MRSQVWLLYSKMTEQGISSKCIKCSEIFISVREKG